MNTIPSAALLRAGALWLCALLTAASLPAQTFVRQPYLQNGSTSAITVRWRTDIATDSVVRYGTSAGSLTSTVSNATSTTEHELRLTGLNANTTYFYSVGSSSVTLASGTDYFFVTAPTSAKPTRVWVLGDPGTGNSSQAAVRNAYYTFTGTRHTDLWLMLGDNAYPDGTDAEYTTKLFAIYPTMLRKSVLWPTFGNHDGHSASSVSETGPYYDQHTLPKQGEAGGTPSGTEAYYSFDYGNIHFICLNSYDVSRSATGAMATWLQSDLANNTKDWTVAFWHHPPYSNGSHKSNTETALVQMRQNFLPILESHGVDLVLGGHSHAYERSFFINGHYGLSSTFTSSMIVQSGDGRTDGNGAYLKSAVGPLPNSGAVYTVAGSSGQTDGVQAFPMMYSSLNVLGSVVLDFDGNRLDAQFIDNTGVRRDYFSIVKSAVSGPPPTPAGLAATPGNAQVALSWSAAGGATSYNVKRSTTSGGPYSTIASPTATSHLDTTVTNGTTYYYVVSAVNANGESANSAQVSATPSAPVAPAAPSNLAVAPAGKKKLALTWTDNSSNETQFKIERSTNNVNFTQITTVAANVTTYTNTSLTSGTTYYYRVRASNGTGDSAYSNTASGVAP